MLTSVIQHLRAELARNKAVLKAMHHLGARQYAMEIDMLVDRCNTLSRDILTCELMESELIKINKHE